MENPLITKKLKKLVDEGNGLKEKLFRAPTSRSTLTLRHNRRFYQEVERWKTGCISILILRFGKESYFFEQFIRAIDIKYRNAGRYCRENVGRALGVIETALGNIKEGLTEDLLYQKEIILFEDLLEQSYEFLKKDFNLVAMIYGRIILESTIKEFAKSKDINIKSMKFDKIIIELKKSEKISQQVEHSLRANYSLGSSFHNLEEFKQIKKNQIRSFLDYIRDNVLTLN